MLHGCARGRQVARKVGGGGDEPLHFREAGDQIRARSIAEGDEISCLVLEALHLVCDLLKTARRRERVLNQIAGVDDCDLAEGG